MKSLECVYLIHFDRPFKHTKHYMGYTRDFERRMARHRKGNGSVLLKRIQEAGIGWQVVRKWDNAPIEFEHRIKRAKNSARFCPVCNPKTWMHHMDETQI